MEEAVQPACGAKDMSMFYCAECLNLRDSDDGCEETPVNRLICAECADEVEEQGGAKRSVARQNHT